MTEFNAEVFYAKMNENIKSNQHRIDELEEQQTTIQKICISIETIAVEMKNMKEAQEEIKKNQEKSQQEFKDSQEKLAHQLREVERQPEKKSASRWELITTVSISALIGGIVAYIVSKIFS